MQKLKEILEYRDFYGMSDGVQDMGLSDYAEVLHKEALVSIYGHVFLVVTFCGLPSAAAGVHLDLPSAP
ncbi:hypothetical protein, partial [Salmonella enterica]|uniref:hypothetical protein n=1 Tax=Salmonella enterica TaxID=28901 RepID=UPI0012FD62A3